MVAFYSSTSPTTYIWHTAEEPVVLTIEPKAELKGPFRFGRRGYWSYPESPRLLTRCAPPRALHTPLLRDYHRARRHARPSRCVRLDTMVGC